MLNFPKNAVHKMAIDCHISNTSAKWVSGLGENPNGKLNESSNGACIRLGLLLNETRKDTGKLRLPDDIIGCFLETAVKQSWYPAWRNWILHGNKSRNNKIDETKLPSPIPSTRKISTDEESK